MKIVLHHTDGRVLRSKSGNDQIIEDLEGLMQKVLSASPNDGGYISFNTRRGWVCVPTRCVRSVELRR